MNSKKAESIRSLIAARRYSDLYDLVARISPFCIDSSNTRRMNDAEQGDWQFACMHLEFLKSFGPGLATATEGRYVRFSYPQEFERWIDSGSPGVSDEELLAYLAAKPT